MDLRSYVTLFRRRLLSIALCVFLGVGAALALSLTSKNTYSAQTQLFVSTSLGSEATTTQVAQGNTFAQARVQSYVELVTNDSVLKPVINNLKLTAHGQVMPTSTLANRVSASAPANRVLLNVTVNWPDAAGAAQVANAISTQYANVIIQLERLKTVVRAAAAAVPATATTPAIPAVTELDTYTYPVNATVSQQAAPPGSPSSPKTRTNIVLGFVIGLVVGLAQAVVRHLLDNTVKTAEDIDAVAGLSVMGWIPMDKRMSRSPIAFRDESHGSRAEAFRQVRANLQFVDIDHRPRVIAVTSSLPSDGKSSTALNLAASLAEGGARVCLVDADLRRPTVAKTLGLIGDVGFTSVLIGQADVFDVLQNAGENLAVLTSGPVPPNPSELLDTAHARAVIGTLAEHVDYVVIDTAPLIPVIDGALVAAIADATLLVVRAGKSTKDQLAKGVDVLKQVGERPVGIVLNMIPRGGVGGGEYSYYYGGYEPRVEKETERSKDPVAVISGGSGAEDAPSEELDVHTTSS